MRWIFLFVLALNLGYIGWELSQSADLNLRLPYSTFASNDVAPIVLLRELKETEIETAANTPEAVAAKDEQSVETSENNPVPGAAGGEKTTEVVSDEAKQDTPETAQKKIEVESQSAPVCYTLGPFREMGNLRKLIRDIKDYVVEASFRSREEREQSMYWVYLPPQQSKAAATALAEELERKKIRDYYVLTNGERVNAISLGHFREKERALKLLKKIERAGFSPLLEPVFKTYTIYWLDYQVQANKTIPLEVLDLRSLPAVSRFDRACS